MYNDFSAKRINCEFLPVLDGVKYFVYEASRQNSATITVFCCIADTQMNIEDNKWLDIADCINHHYLTGEISEFEQWNSYLVFICGTEVEKSLKYQIENDKFYMRKFLEKKPKGWDDENPEMALIELLNNRLLLSHINIDQYKGEDFLSSPLLSHWGKSIVDNGILSGTSIDSKSKRSMWIENALRDAMGEV